MSVIIIVLLLLFDCATASTHKHDRLRDAEVVISAWSGCTITGTVDGTPVTLFMDVASCPLRVKVPGRFRIRYDQTCGAVVEMTDGPRIETPMPPSCPTATPQPTPTPLPTPVPTPAPACAMTVTSVNLPAWSSGKLVVNLINLNGQATTVRAVSSSGQVTVTPPTVQISGTSAVVEFRLQSKKKSSNVVVSGPCGSQTVAVNVQ